MSRPHIINAVDIGTGAIKLISVIKKPKGEGFEILGQAQLPSFGVRKGVVTDPYKVGEIVSSLIKKVEADTGQRIDSVYASVGGNHISGVYSHGLVSVSRADQKISEEDVDRVITAAKTFPLQANKEVIGIFPKEFTVDGVNGIREAVGLQGVRLEADVLVLCGFSPYLKNSNKTIACSGVQVNDLLPDILASSRAVLTPREKELGVCVLDIGAGTTGMSVYEEGALIHTVVFPVGSGHITSDIAVIMTTDVDTAERIKIEFGRCGLSEKGDKKITIGEEEKLEFSAKELSEIIEARISDVFDFASKELKKIGKAGQLPAGLVLTGGGAKIPGIKELARKTIKLPVRIGCPPAELTSEEDPAMSAAAGLVLEACYLEDEERTGPSGAGPGIFSRIKKIFKIFVP